MDERDVESRNLKLGQSSQKKGQVRCVCVWWACINMHGAECWSGTIKPPLKIYSGETEEGRAGWEREKTGGRGEWEGGERALRFVSQSGLYQRHLSTHQINTHTFTHGCSDSVHFNSPVTSSYNTRQWLFEQTLVFRSVFRASWQAQARANWLAHHNYRSHLCSERVTANLSKTSPRPTLSKCHLDRAVLQARHPSAF